MKSTVVKRSIVLAGHKTSVSLEDAFWRGLKDIATTRRMTLSDLIGKIDVDREQGNLSSALRLFVLGHYQKRAASGLVVDNSVRRAAEYTNVQ
jgi:predicted DNA-binding ribbon-helix-helix protein